MSHIDKLDLKTPDFVNENSEKLAVLFPHCVTETAEGRKIDFDLLQQELSHDIVEGNRERYRLEWPGKREAIVTANLPTTKTLRPVREDSVDFDNTENIYIEGDNLEVLKLLQESYFGKIKMIYIDPPYNTGNDFVYKDNFAMDNAEWSMVNGEKDEYGTRLVANPETSGRYHSDWLTMMYPRLKLARNLLTDDGVIFISIDDNEVHNLRKVCDEVFGEGNFVGQFIWKKKQGGGNDSNVLVVEHEYIIAYTKSLSELKFNLDTNYILDDNLYPFKDENGEYGLITLDKSSIRFSESLVFEIVDKEGNSYFPRVVKGKQSCWRWGRQKVENEFNDLVFKNGKVYTKYYRPNGVTPKSLLIEPQHGRTETGNDDIKNIFDNKNPFSYPKPVVLVKHFLTIGAKEDDIILDFFSGSATTAHAVMQLNAEDGGKRKFIMVQLPEPTDENSEAYKAGYENICEIGKDRIRRAGKKIKAPSSSPEGGEKESSPKLFDAAESAQLLPSGEVGRGLDIGFRVYRLADSNMQDVYYRPQDYKQESLNMFADNIKPDRTADDLLAQVMLDWGLPLSYRIEQIDINGKQVFRVAQDSLIACFDTGIDEAFAKAIAKEKPLRVVFRDSGFASDTAKINVQQLLKQLSPETEMKVI